MIEPHIVQLNQFGKYTLTHQKLYSQTAKEFDAYLDEQDYKMIKLLDQTDQEYIIKKYHKEAIRPIQYFSKVWNDKLYDVVRPIIEKKIVEVIRLIGDKPFFEAGKEGDPVHKLLRIAKEPASVLFHFRKNEEGTRYFPTIKFNGQRIEFMFKNAEVITNLPAYMLLGKDLLCFDAQLEGKKLIPFLNKRYIDIPKTSELTYYKKFVAPLIEKHNVYAEGFQIITEQYEAFPVLKIVHAWNNTVQLVLSFQYGKYVFPYQSGTKVSVSLEHKNDEYVFHRVKRSLSWEATKINFIKELGLEAVEGSGFVLKTNNAGDMAKDTVHTILEWLNESHEALLEQNFVIQQEDKGRRFFIGKSKIDVHIKESNDWFDIYAIVYFGDFEIPFIQLRDHILNGHKEFILPNAEVAIIPESWFAQFHNLFSFAEGSKDLRLRKYHIGLVQEYADSELAHLTMDRKLNNLLDFDQIDDVELPKKFHGTLRPYQKAGYDWFHFLKRWNFGGCLADDMGLGKTIQTLALLQKTKEESNGEIKHTIAAHDLFSQNGHAVSASSGATYTSMVVMPTSLIHNWLNEAKKFTPELKILVYTGTFREKNIERFHKYDVVLTTYGIVRMDIELLKHFYFHYIILDESQIIKNPASKISRSVRGLKSKYRLILSGTPVENSVLDLWSQMSFVNPGLLGSHTFFSNEFGIPIDKKQDEEKANKLQTIIKPFILRRTKQQVASELPPKTEHIYYSDMSSDQDKLYEETKSYYRNEILKVITEQGIAKSQIYLLQGLNKLRQIANHPKMVDATLEAESGKFTDVIHTLDTIVNKGHKVLVFSQFVKHLAIFKEHFEDKQMRYSYLDGSVTNRQDVVEEFRNDADIKVFLISIKAGGVGLNLTEADYVFILDPWWNPAVEQQAIDRTHRIGQKNNVFIYKFITKNSVEEKILALQHRKKKIADSLITVEDSFIKTLTESDIRAILD